MGSTGKGILDRLFKLRANGTTPRREILAGITTFAAMAYILAVNPMILANAGIDPVAQIGVTALAAAIGCFLMALLANYPIALAPGMGPNSYLAFVVVLTAGVPWQSALGFVFWNGILFLLLSISGLRSKIAEALPHAIQIGIQCGIGFFIALLGLQGAGLVIGHPVTLVTYGDILQPATLLSFAGLLVMTVLLIKGFKGGIILVILGLAALGLLIPHGEGTLTTLPDSVMSMPQNLGLLVGQLDLLYPFTHFREAMPVIITLLLLDLFDSLGTIVAVSRRANLLDNNGKLPRMGKALTADAIATVAGAALGTSTTTSYVESAAGVEAGGRTGMTAAVVGICFCLALFFSPIIASIPAMATAPALIVVGLLMATGLKEIDFKDEPCALAAILTMLIIPLSFSITHGIALGLLAYVVLMGATRRGREIHWLTYVITLTFVAFFAIEHL